MRMKPQTFREMREQAGLLQEELALRLHLTKGTISKIENGRQGITVEQATRWAEACGHVLTVMGPEHEALIRELAKLSMNEASLVRWVARLVPSLHPLRKADLENLLEGWSRVDGSDNSKNVKNLSSA